MNVDQGGALLVEQILNNPNNSMEPGSGSAAVMNHASRVGMQQDVDNNFIQQETKKRSAYLSSDSSSVGTYMKENKKHKDTKKQVQIHVTYLKFGEINTLTEKFDADVLIRSKWRETRLDKYHGKPEPDLDKYWNPGIFIENAIGGDPKVTSSKTVTFDKENKGWLTELKRFRGTYMEKLELWDFPFDVQDLTVFVMSSYPKDEVELVEDSKEIHKINRSNFIDEQEWYIYKYLESKKMMMAKDPADPDTKSSVVRVRAKVARRPDYFIFNNFLVTFLIVILSFATFAVSYKLPQNRLQLSFTLVLTAIAFKFVVNQSVPKLSYLTYLDRYVMSCLILLTVVSLWHSAVTLVPDMYWYKDYIAIGIVGGTYIFYNIYFWLKIYFGPYNIRRRMTVAEIDYVIKIQEKSARNNLTQKERLELNANIASKFSNLSLKKCNV